MKKADLIREIKTRIGVIEAILTGLKKVPISETPTNAEKRSVETYVELGKIIDELKRLTEVV